MIQLQVEQLVALGEVPQVLPRRGQGKRLHVSSVYRWVTRGVRGILLETLRVGGSTYTSLEALQRFAERLSPRSQGAAPANPGQRRRAVARATQLAQLALA
jgi:hypothetical protein